MNIEQQRLILKSLEFEANIKDLELKEEMSKFEEVKQKNDYLYFEIDFSFEKNWNKWLWRTLPLRVII